MNSDAYDKNQKAQAWLDDLVEVENILAMSDDEVIATVKALGEDPEEVAAHVRKLFENVLRKFRFGE